MNDPRIIPPHTTLLSLAGLALLSVLLMLVVPEKGIAFGSWTFRFKQFHTLFDVPEKPKIEDVGKYLEELELIAASDTIASDTTDSSGVIKPVHLNTKTSLQFENNDASPLFSFFESLKNADSGKGSVHVLHYGDSQIESDRMSGYIRQQMQEKFGGYGPGLVTPVPIAPPGNISMSSSNNWKRYTAFGFEEKKSIHNRYGIMASYGRFTTPVSEKSPVSSDTTEAWLEIAPSRLTQGRSRVFSSATLFFGNYNSTIDLEILLNDSLIDTLNLPANKGLKTLQWNFNSTPESFRIVFRGQDSPDVHALLLQNQSGVYVDNIALRGSNGNIFKRIASAEIKEEFAAINAELFILQFGGNALPYVDSDKSAEQYGNFFQAQIQYLKQLAPGAAFIVVGPSDMSTTVDGNYQTWPYLEKVRDAMKDAAFKEDCAFWDMYEVMGGENSMVSWVNNDPPYAGPDYTHFTPLGARKVAELLYKAIIEDYNAWLNSSEPAGDEQTNGEPLKSKKHK